MRLRLLTGLVLLILVGCASHELHPVTVSAPARSIDFQTEVKPILEQRCTVCHSCYNAACQLKLDSFEGLDRGISKNPVYDGARLSAGDPSRLFIDAHSTEQWRQKGFFSVTQSLASNGYNDSLFMQMLSHKMERPQVVGQYVAEAEKLTCAADNKELGRYLKKNPHNGMPFGFPALDKAEFDTIAGWLAQGAQGPTASQQQALVTPDAEDQPFIERWEAFLNRDDPKYAMTARYLYEHLFLAHLRFGTPANTFYELVRSRSAPGQPIDLIATVRPYDDPGVERVYYRLRKIHSTIVQKTHMVVEFDDRVLKRMQQLFIEPPWLQAPHRLGYDPVTSANPFVTFEQIPPRIRYQFMLDHSHYIVMSFIHGPVCKGQIALNVIDDHFWVLFMDPDRDLSVKHPGFLRLHSKQLRMPTEDGSNYGIFSALENPHRDAAVEFYRARQSFYAANYYGGLDYDAIWRGDRPQDAPLLTVYRHFDSASVHKGALGSLPKTVWVVDYPLFERIYYSLVAGFDVYGNVGHQLADRLYMDRLRIEGESYFLDFLPREQREALMQSWNIGVKLSKLRYNPAPMPAAIAYASNDPKREFIEHVVDRHLLPTAGIGFDKINYLRAGDLYPPLPTRYEHREDYLRALRTLSQPGMPFVRLINDHNANLAFIRIRLTDGDNIAATMVANRWHDNVAFLLREGANLNSERDSLDFLPGLIGSYPNYFFDVSEADLPDFLDLLAHFDRSPEHLQRLSRYGINRADPRFWQAFDWFQQRVMQDDPVRGGLLDLNRYNPVAKSAATGEPDGT